MEKIASETHLISQKEFFACLVVLYDHKSTFFETWKFNKCFWPNKKLKSL